MVERVAHKRRGVQAVGRDDQVALARREALEARVGVDVEQSVLDKVEVGEAHACLPKEDLRHVSEDVALARAVHDGQHARGGAAGASSHLQHHELVLPHLHLPILLPLLEKGEHGLHHGHHAAIVKGVDRRLLVERQHRVHGAAGEEQLLVGDLAREGLGKL